MNNKEKFKELLTTKTIKRGTIAKAFDISKDHTYQIAGDFANLSKRMSKQIDEGNFTVIDDTLPNWKISIFIERKNENI